MCGIIGYTGTAQAAPRIIEKLALLEYRGYDSAGLATQFSDGLRILRRADYRASVAKLRDAVDEASPPGTCGVGHTRWATHGAVSIGNTHPITDHKQRVAIVHNGIIENYQELRREVEDLGATVQTETDSEVFALLMGVLLDRGESVRGAFLGAVRRVLGSSSLLAISVSEPGLIIGARIGNAGGLVVSGDGASAAVSSDAIALVGDYERAVYLGDRELFYATAGEVSFGDWDGNPIEKEAVDLPREREQASKGRFSHFLAKEIAEQPQIALSAIRQRVQFDKNRVDILQDERFAESMRGIERVIFIGTGSSYNVAELGALQFEALAQIPAVAELSSEIYLRRPLLNERTLAVCITQSGETADTLVALGWARKAGARTIAVVENAYSQATRIAEHTITINAGVELSVCATKTVTATMIALAQLAVQFGDIRGTLADETRAELVQAIGKLGGAMERTLELNANLEGIAERLANCASMLYIGRFYQYPICREGALKMKEIAYIHAEGVAGGEMKHGVNALIVRGMPVVAIATAGGSFKKMVSSINEAHVRGGAIIAVTDAETTNGMELAEATIRVPRLPEVLAPIVTVLPLQQLAYQTALKRGNDPDRPRNLAKTVTVE